MDCIFVAASGESAKVRTAISLPLARTVICAVLACITKPSNLLNPVGLGFTALMMMGTAVSITMGATDAGVCAAAPEHDNAVITAPTSNAPAILKRGFIPFHPWQCAVISGSVRL